MCIWAYGSIRDMCVVKIALREIGRSLFLESLVVEEASGKCSQAFVQGLLLLQDVSILDSSHRQ